ncbi:PspC domain-containing protein [Hufsiella ginkgonis]|uniref:PspC domain-containing protein n=1 Tax=Hufsiella ginkgonis TaxID=2695274 RepID=A0A7K1Y3U3_9SPHI|nr:PspC domain-containing protein [Hufsiella ginkgonis]MXV17954.1 PspC domain-containing protein [Hufsiella ginkgonis]
MEKKLQRDENNKMIGGVCAGLAAYFDWEVTWVRIAFLVALVSGGAGFPAYIILWIAVPKKPFMPFGNPNPGAAPDYRVYNSDRPYPGATPQPDFSSQYAGKKKDDSGKLVAGFILIGVGVCFLINQLNILPLWFAFWKLWPLALIIPGIMLLTKAARTPESPVVAPKQPIDLPEEEPTANPNTTDPSQNI